MKRIYGIAIIALISLGFAGCDSNTNTTTNKIQETIESTGTATSNSDVLTLQGDEQELATNNSGSENKGSVRSINTEEFLSEIFDYNANPTKWVYKGNKPAIIDFYATWCGPCKKVAPIMEELAKEYAGKINIYKIDTDKESHLAGDIFRITSIPSILYIPANGQPMMYQGLMPKEKYIELINNNLLK